MCDIYCHNMGTGCDNKCHTLFSGGDCYVYWGVKAPDKTFRYFVKGESTGMLKPRYTLQRLQRVRQQTRVRESRRLY